jgi:hypothetical protein
MVNSQASVANAVTIRVMKRKRDDLSNTIFISRFTQQKKARRLAHRCGLSARKTDARLGWKSGV